MEDPTPAGRRYIERVLVRLGSRDPIEVLSQLDGRLREHLPDLDVAALGALRAHHVQWLGDLGPEQLRRTGIHPTRGTESVERFGRLWAGHDLLHLDQVVGLGETAQAR